MPENVNLESCPESESRLPLQPEGPIKQNKWQGLSEGGGERPGRPGAETWPKLSNLLAISASVARHTPLTPAPAQSALDLLLLLLSRL